MCALACCVTDFKRRTPTVSIVCLFPIHATTHKFERACFFFFYYLKIWEVSVKRVFFPFVFFVNFTRPIHVSNREITTNTIHTFTFMDNFE